ncbi:undecaprenyl/decaprenyl-phosphate alpha-N-acetylglucosaminyl 1-phosphate transferase [Nocardioides marmoriginsengisoli]|uniref:Undecaprenyl/decaprenyl-phosphate alpha-N-acetylglucosaminyl 1-phosphate transferase n=1 Tax=Nocardioides marmoriginsengisoli TaxID=661483 RepID=A0A3N0CPF2_9ACTN|nr:MraY family glycosyltransferase [Nocardioides marmoriginsengisoli]RNL65250.1 undecaprenyl/decaprenyl-phosphate alpha-N-acetylglucosaminyl 1-phosphate transferase [Nocardioides marmoriginsengisoli]
MREYLLVFLVAAVVSYLLCVVARELAMRLGAVAQVRDRDVHAVPIPYFGGVAMLGGLGAGLLIAHQLPFLSLSQPQIFHDAGVVLTGGAIICAVGVLDDLIELDALTKLGGQVLAAGYLVLNGVQLYSLRVPGRDQIVLDSTQAVLFSIVLIVGTVNAINFVDGLDGLASGMVCIGAFAFFLFSYRLADANNETLAITAALLCACLAGACVGFLPHNFYPARIFMGDSGSMLLGLVLSGATLSLTGQFAGLQLNGGTETLGTTLVILLPILLPLAILVVPFVDLVLAVVRRTRRGQMFYQPDKEHLHHRLLEFGHSQRKAVVIMWLWAGLIGFGAVLVSLYTGPATVVVVAVWAAATAILTFVVPRLRSPV